MTKNPPSEIVLATPVEISVLPKDPYPQPDRHPARVYLLKLRPGSRPAQQNVLELFVRAALGCPPPPLPRPRDPAYQRERALWLEKFWRFPWHTLRYQHVAAVQTAMTTMKVPPHSHTVINRSITAMRRVLKEARRLGWMKPEDYETAIDIEKVEGERLPKGRHIEKDELIEIIDKCSAEKGANRRALYTAAIGMIWGTGCRRGDVASAQYDAYDSAKKTIVVIGKRNKQRKIELPVDVWKAINAWVLVRGTHPGPLFHPVSQSDRVMTDRRIHPRTIGTILDKIVAQCTSLQASRFTSHDFRRTFISNEIDKGTNLSALAKMVGHDDVNTTVGYDLSKQRAMRKIADGIKLPTRNSKTNPLTSVNVASLEELVVDMDSMMESAVADDEKIFADAAIASNWIAFGFCQSVFMSSGNVELRSFDDGVSGEKLSRLIAGEKVTVTIFRFPRADDGDERLKRFCKGNESAEHSRLKLSTFLWLVSHFKPASKTISLEPSMAHGIPDLFLSESGGVWVECGDTEAIKVLNALVAGYSCLLVPYVCCSQLGGIMLKIKEDALAQIREETEMNSWKSHPGRGFL